MEDAGLDRRNRVRGWHRWGPERNLDQRQQGGVIVQGLRHEPEAGQDGTAAKDAFPVHPIDRHGRADVYDDRRRPRPPPAVRGHGIEEAVKADLIRPTDGYLEGKVLADEQADGIAALA